MNARRPLLLAMLLAKAGALASCRPPQTATQPRPAAAIVLVESAPLETTLDHAAVANAADVWPAMIDAAKTTIDLAEFYASDAPAEDRAARSRLAPVVAAIERAVTRGVRVRFLADSVFAPKYPDTLARLGRAGATVRTIDVSKTSGGILHAKYFVIDGHDTFLGSQNFDWRALDHIFEMGVRVDSRAFAGAMSDVFETDWAIAGGEPPTTRLKTSGPVSALDLAGGGRLSLVASPKGWLPDESTWELPRMVALLEGAARAVDVQVLTYKTSERDGSPFPTLDDALRRAAARGVHVRLLVSDWSSKPGSDARKVLEAVAGVPNVEVRVITVPRWSGGDVPFARVAHAKYMVVDGTPLGAAPGSSGSPAAHAWIGTSNWEGDYFTKSRNVGVVVDGGALPGALEQVFASVWASAYTQPLSASAGAAPPSSSGPAPP